MRNLTPTGAARLLDVKQQWMSRRLTGVVPFDVDELDMLCERLDISFEYVTTGIRALPGDGGSRLGYTVDQSVDTIPAAA